VNNTGTKKDSIMK